MSGKALPVAAYLMVAAGASLVASCGQTSYGDTLRVIVQERGSKAADTTLENLEWGLCNAMTFGAIRRKYIGTPKWHAFLTICEIPESQITPYTRVEIPK